MTDVEIEQASEDIILKKETDTPVCPNCG